MPVALDKFQASVEVFGHRSHEIALVSTIMGINKLTNPPIFDITSDSCRQIFDAIGDPVFVTTVEEGAIIEINNTALDYLKSTREEVLGKNFVQLGWWASASQRMEFVRSVDPRGGITKKEITFHKDGKAYVFILSARLIIFNKEQALFVHLKDITREKHKARALEESETRLREAESIARVGHWKYVPERRELVWSGENFRILGYEPGEVTPSYKRFLDRVHPDDRKRVKETFEIAVDNMQESYETVFRVLTEQGQLRFIKERGRLSFKDGRLEEAIGIAQDVTKEYEANLKIHLSEKRWRDTFNAIDDSLMLLDRAQTILLANDAAAKFCGMDLSDLQGCKCYELIHADKRAPVDCPFHMTCSMKRSQRQEVNIPELEKTFLVVTSPVLDAQGNIEYVVHLAHDVTMLKKTEAMLRHAQKMEALGTLAGGIAHDFNNILTGTMGFHELALMPETDPDTVRRYISTSLELLKRASELVKQILTLSRQDEKAEGPVILNLLVKEIVKMIRASIPPEIEIHHELPGSDVVVIASSVNIHQVIMNLCTNAYQAMKDGGGDLTIRLEIVQNLPEALGAGQGNPGTGQWAHIQVKDTGCGIPPEIRERIFEPYFTTKGPGEGTGLGLALVHGIVKQYQGHLSLKSVPGKGSTFDIYLPLAKEASNSLGAMEKKGITRGSGRIMLVDDEQAIITLLSFFLEDIGYEIMAYTDPFSALKAFLQSPEDIDIFITDLAMPKMKGTDLIREIRKVRADIPVIMLTGLLDHEGEDVVKDMGVDLLLRKPLSLESLSKNIEKLLMN